MDEGKALCPGDDVGGGGGSVDDHGAVPVPSAAMTPPAAPPGCSTWRMGTAGSRQLQTALRVIQSSCGEPNRVQVDTKINNV